MSQPPAHIQQQPINGYNWDVNAYKQINNLPIVDHGHHQHNHQSGHNFNAHYLPQAGHMYLPRGTVMQPPPHQQQQSHHQQQQQQQVQHVSPQLYQLPGANHVEEDIYLVQRQQQHQQPVPFQPAASHQAYCPQQVPYLQQMSSSPSVQLTHPLINHHLQQAPVTNNVRYHNHNYLHHHPHHQQANGRAMAPTAIYHQPSQYSEAMQQHHYELMSGHHQQAHHCQQQQQRQYQDNFYHQPGGFSSGGGELVAPRAPPSQILLVDSGGGGAEIGGFVAGLHNHNQQQQTEAEVADELYYQSQMDMHPTIKQQQEEEQHKLIEAAQQQQRNANQMSPKAQVLASQSSSQQHRKQQQPPPLSHNLEQFQSQVHSHHLDRHQHPQQQRQSEPMVATLPPQSQSLLRTSKSTDFDPVSLVGAKQSQQLQNPRSQSLASPAYRQPPLPGQQLQNVESASSSDLGLGDPAPEVDTGSSYQETEQEQLQERQRQGQQQQQQQQQDLVEMGFQGSLSPDWLDTICRHLIEHMSQFGICVIDNFLGSLKGELILKEVQQLYRNGQHCTKGRVVSSKPGDLGTTNAIRNDWVIWIDGCEDGCAEINHLIQTLCSVITNSARLSLYSNNGLDKVVISKRTKAHVSCYPGNGTRYIKHVDNPNGDGRVITSIYYLNKNWFTKRDGGLLRMFPAGMDEVANIEPLFDRALFFWSDRRNPHEVLPAYRDRYAITVWYIGEERPQV